MDEDDEEANGGKLVECCPDAKSTGQQRGWKNREHTKVCLTVLLLYNDN